MNSTRSMQQKFQHGISLIEVLVAIIVMTFGLLGISGLMMAGVNNSTGSDLASRANQSASEIMDAMRANRGNADKYVVNYETKASTFTGTTTADIDRKQWLAAVELLPAGTGQIKAVTGVNTYEVRIRFSNCIGTLNKTQLDACTSNTATSKRELTFVFKV